MPDFENQFKSTKDAPNEREALMELVTSLLTFAPLRGYRTQVAGFLAFIALIAHFLTGEVSLLAFIQQVPGMLMALGLTALGAKVNKAQGASSPATSVLAVAKADAKK